MRYAGGRAGGSGAASCHAASKKFSDAPTLRPSTCSQAAATVRSASLTGCAAASWAGLRGLGGGRLGEQLGDPLPVGAPAGQQRQPVGQVQPGGQQVAGQQLAQVGAQCVDGQVRARPGRDGRREGAVRRVGEDLRPDHAGVREERALDVDGGHPDAPYLGLVGGPAA